MNATVTNLQAQLTPVRAQVEGHVEPLTYKDFNVESNEPVGFKFVDNVFSANVPTLDPERKFPSDVLNYTLMHLSHPNQDGLWIWGKQGTGKTSFAEQVCARMAWDCFIVNGTGATESSDWMGFSMPTLDGREVFMPRQLYNAYKFGGVFLLNEADMLRPDELTLFNTLLDRGNVTIVENKNEVITAHPNFRLICTANTNGKGDPLGMMTGIKEQNTATLSRFDMLEMPAPSHADERHMLIYKTINFMREANIYRNDAEELITLIAEPLQDMAAEIRSDSELVFSVEPGPREMLRFMRKVFYFPGHTNKLKNAIQTSWIGALPEEEQRAATHLFEKHFKAICF